jgi:histidine phosphotransferase ChpT
MKIDAVDFASLLCSRLCHDVLSPVSALSNGLELLSQETDPERRQQCLELLGGSTRATVAKLKFFRLAFGAAGSLGDVVDSDEARDALEGIFAVNGRVELGWMVAEPALSKPAVKMMLNLALIAGDALVRGGQLDIGAETVPGRTEIVVRASGGQTKLDDAIRQILLGMPPHAGALAPRLGPALLVRAMATSYQGRLQVSADDPGHLMLGALIHG